MFVVGPQTLWADPLADPLVTPLPYFRKYRSAKFRYCAQS